MADKLHFNLVSPERELFSGDVDMVTAPGAEGDFGVLPGHAPFMTTIRPGALIVKDGADTRRIFVRGGFADVTPEGLTVLAEEAITSENVDRAALQDQFKQAQSQLDKADNDVARSAARERLDFLQAMIDGAAH